jgi:hypothetical protein
MSNLGDVIERRGIARGIKIAKAKKRTTFILEDICNLMDSCSWSAEQAMAALKIPESDRSKYAALLRKGPH